jgi:hypothetical protein
MVAFKSRHDLDKVVLDNPSDLKIELFSWSHSLQVCSIGT